MAAAPPLADSREDARWGWEIARRVITAVGLSIFAYRALAQFLAEHHLYLVLLFAGEAIMVLCVLFARFSKNVNRAPLIVMATLAVTFSFLVIRLTPGTMLVPASVGFVIQSGGNLLQIAGKLWLGRSFGLLPANRGVVTSGPYRLVRHPIYFGYLLNHIGFVLVSFSWWNLAVYLVIYALQVGRILEEERLLRGDGRYRAYTEQVRYRLVPGIF